MPAGNPASGRTASGVSVDVNAILTERASMNKEKLDWRSSIVDLMKLLNLDCSLTTRKQLAHELPHRREARTRRSYLNIRVRSQTRTIPAIQGGAIPSTLSCPWS
jgi:hypothetical protein